MLAIYMTQTCTWKAKTGVNDYGEATFAASATINCRWQGKRKLVRDAQGREIISEQQCLTLSAVGLGDTLTYDGSEYPVITVERQPFIDGTLQGYMVYL